MNIVEKAITNVFPDAGHADLMPNTKLASLPGWDSMNAINLQIEIESEAAQPGLGLVLTPHMTIADLLHELGKRGITV